MTRDEEADEEEVARGRDKDCRSDVATRRLVSPGDSKRPARFPRPAEAVKLAERDSGSGKPGSGSPIQSGAPTFVVARGLECDTRRASASRRRHAEAHIWRRSASRRYVTRKRKTSRRRLNCGEEFAKLQVRGKFVRRNMRSKKIRGI